MEENPTTCRRRTDLVWQVLPHVFYLRRASSDPVNLPHAGELYGWAERVRQRGHRTYWMVHWRYRGARLDLRAATAQRAAAILRLRSEVEKV